MEDKKIDDSLNNINDNLVKKYNVSGPYYSSYPVLQSWSDKFSHVDYFLSLEKSFSESKEFPLSLYIHVPFCPKLCYYCCCNKIISSDYTKIREFLKHLFLEINLLSDFFKKHSITPKVKELHLGGGSPSYMEETEFDLLLEKLQPLVNFNELDEFIIEVDVRTVDKKKLKHYSEKGVNRISFGIQEFNPKVQKAVNRVQPLSLIQNLLSQDIRNCFKSINFDILYGLPLQTRESFKSTIETAKRLSPDRMCIFNYDHRPNIYKHQKMIKKSELPDAIEKTMMFVDTVKTLLEDNYEYIGVDHFAKTTGDLAKAKQKGTLGRNFNGYPEGRTDNLIGLGPTSLTAFDNFYSQDAKTLTDYYKSIKKNNLPICCGYKLNKDDLIRRSVIHKIISNNFLDFSKIEKEYNIDFNKYFQQEIKSLQHFVREDMLILSDNSLNVTLLGRVFIRHICMVFDNYLKNEKD